MQSPPRVGGGMATQKKLVAGQSCGPNSVPVSFETNLMGQVVVSVIYLDACDKKNYGALPWQHVGGIEEG